MDWYAKREHKYKHWACRKPTGALVLFVRKITPQRVAAKLQDIPYHNSELCAAKAELAKRLKP